MQVITGPRGSGKTTELIKESNRLQHSIVVYNCEERKRIMRSARELQLSIPMVVTQEEFLRGPIPGVTGYILDDLDSVLRELARGKPVSVVAIEPFELRRLVLTDASQIKAGHLQADSIKGQGL